MPCCLQVQRASQEAAKSSLARQAQYEQVVGALQAAEAGVAAAQSAMAQRAVELHAVAEKHSIWREEHARAAQYLSSTWLAQVLSRSFCPLAYFPLTCSPRGMSSPWQATEDITAGASALPGAPVISGRLAAACAAGVLATADLPAELRHQQASPPRRDAARDEPWVPRGNAPDDPRAAVVVMQANTEDMVLQAEGTLHVAGGQLVGALMALANKWADLPRDHAELSLLAPLTDALLSAATSPAERTEVALAVVSELRAPHHCSRLAARVGGALASLDAEASVLDGRVAELEKTRTALDTDADAACAATAEADDAAAALDSTCGPTAVVGAAARLLAAEAQRLHSGCEAGTDGTANGDDEASAPEVPAGNRHGGPPQSEAEAALVSCPSLPSPRVPLF